MRWLVGAFLGALCACSAEEDTDGSAEPVEDSGHEADAAPPTNDGAAAPEPDAISADLDAAAPDPDVGPVLVDASIPFDYAPFPDYAPPDFMLHEPDTGVDLPEGYVSTTYACAYIFFSACGQLSACGAYIDETDDSYICLVPRHCEPDSEAFTNWMAQCSSLGAEEHLETAVHACGFEYGSRSCEDTCAGADPASCQFVELNVTRGQGQGALPCARECADLVAGPP